MRFLICLLCFIPLLNATEYQLQDIGLCNENSSKATGINDHGDVVGIVSIDGEQRTFLWHHTEGKKIIDDIPKGAYSSAINNKGEVIGCFWSWDGWWSPKWVLHPFLWSEDRGFNDLGEVDSKNTSAVRINDKSQIILITSDNQCYCWDDWDVNKIDEASNCVQNGELDLVYLDFNNESELVFLKKEAAKPTLYKVSFKTWVLTKLLTERKEVPMVTVFNSNGNVGGFFLAGNKFTGFISESGNTVTIPDFALMDMNDAGVAVGLLTAETATAGIYEDGKLLNINNLLAEDQPFAIERVVSLRGINQKGQIIGVASTWDTKKAVLLNPVTK